MNKVATNLLVATRGHDILHGEPVMGASTAARAEAAAGYILGHSAAFEQAFADGTGGLVVAAGGYPDMAADIRATASSAPEALLVEQHLAGAGVPQEYVVTEADSSTTFEIIYNTWLQGYWGDGRLSRENPLGIVSQASQYPRLEYFARKVFRLPKDAVQLIQAPGEEDPAIARDERRALLAMKLMGPLARTPLAMWRAEQRLRKVTNALVGWGLLKRPGTRYLSVS